MVGETSMLADCIPPSSQVTLPPDALRVTPLPAQILVLPSTNISSCIVPIATVTGATITLITILSETCTILPLGAVQFAVTV